MKKTPESLGGANQLEEEIKIKFAEKTKASEKHPDRNEDKTLVDLKHRIFAVFDGIGGHKDGDEASKLVRDYVQKHISEIQDGMDTETVKEILLRIILESDDVVKNEALGNGMGTTASILKIHKDSKGKNLAIIANVGDSRVYKIEKDGKVVQITQDDDILSYLNLDPEKKAEISRKLANVINPEELSDELLNPEITDPEYQYSEKRLFKTRNKVTNDIGHIVSDPKILSIEINEGDLFFITSDGIHDNLTIKEIENILKQSKNLEEASEEMLKKSQERSRESKEQSIRAKQDDMSVVMVEIENSKDAQASTPAQAKKPASTPGEVKFLGAAEEKKPEPERLKEFNNTVKEFEENILAQIEKISNHPKGKTPEGKALARMILEENIDLIMKFNSFSDLEIHQETKEKIIEFIKNKLGTSSEKIKTVEDIFNITGEAKNPEPIGIPEDKAIKIVKSLKVGDLFTSSYFNKNNTKYSYKITAIPANTEEGEKAIYHLSYTDTDGEEKEHVVNRELMIGDFMRGATLETHTPSKVPENSPVLPEEVIAEPSVPVNSTEKTPEEIKKDLELMNLKIQEYLDNQKREAIPETWTDEDEKDLGLLEMTIAVLDQSITKNTSEIQKTSIMAERKEAQEQLDILLAKKERINNPVSDQKSEATEVAPVHTETPEVSNIPPPFPTQPATPEVGSQTPEKRDLEKALDEARIKYAEAYKKFLASANKFTKAKRLIFGAKFKDKELPQELKDLEKEYERATVAFGQEMYKTKEGELNNSALSEDERKAQLNAFKQNEIFTEVIIKEQIKLNALKIENLPSEEKKIVKLMKKGLGWYTGLQPSWKKLAISTALGGLAFAAMPGTAITAGGMGTYLAIRAARGAAGITAAKTTAKVFDKAYDWLFKEKSAAKRKKQEKELVNLFKEEESFDTGFAKSKEGYAKILERERKAKRNRLITKAVLSMAAGGAASIGTGYGIGQMMHGTPDSLNVAGGKENVGTDASLKAQHNANAKLHEEYLKRIGAEKELEKAKTDLKEAKEALKEVQNSTPNASSTPNQASNQTGSQGKGVELKKFDPKSNAVVHKGEGIERVFIRQIDENPKLAQELGFKGDITNKTALHKFAGQEAHRIALEKGYVDSATGKEVWIKDANKVAFELKADANGKPIVTLRTIDGKVSEMEYKEEGYKFGKTPNNEYEYEHQRASVPNKNTGVIEPNSTKTHTIGLKEETLPIEEGHLNPGTAENVYAPEKHSLGIGEEKSFFAEKIEKIKNIKEQIEANMDAKNTKTNLGKIPRRQHWETEQVTQPSATEIYNHDIRHIFTDSKSGNWTDIRDLGANNFLHDNNYNTENYTHLKEYINNLIEKTNESPSNGIFGFLAETNEEYIKRAIKYALDHNIKI